MTTNDAKSYLANREIPQLFESLMTGLMYYRPEDHLEYLVECLYKVKKDSLIAINWNSFIDMKVLPPIPLKAPMNLETSDTDLSMKRSSPLPPIGSRIVTGIEECHIVLLIGGPGSDKAIHAQAVVERYSGWSYINTADILATSRTQSPYQDSRVGMLINEQLMKINDIEGKKGILISGYPRNEQQYNDIKTMIGKIDLVVVLDLSENELRTRADGDIGRYINTFSNHTLPTLRKFDADGKLILMDANKSNEHIQDQLYQIINNIFYQGQNLLDNNSKLSVSNIINSNMGDTESKVIIPSERKQGLTDSKIYFIVGGPGSNRKQIMKDFSQKQDYIILSTGDLLRETATSRCNNVTLLNKIENKQMIDEGTVVKQIELAIANEINSDKPIIIHGFPRNIKQLQYFYERIGGAEKVILFDCNQISDRKTDESLALIMDVYKNETLPVLSWLDDASKLIIINVNKENDIDTKLCESLKQQTLPGFISKTTDQVNTNKSYPELVTIEQIDQGRNSQVSNNTLIALIGFDVKKYSDQIEIEDVDVHDYKDSKNLIDFMNSSKKIILLTSFPESKDQIEEFNIKIGKLSSMIVIDESEDFAFQSRHSQQVEHFRKYVMPLLAYYDGILGQDNFILIDGNTEDKELLKQQFTNVLTKLIAQISNNNARNDPSLCMSVKCANKLDHLELITYDSGRLNHLPTEVVITSVIGSNDVVDLNIICDNINAVHISNNHIDQVLHKLKDCTNSLLVLDNYPISKEHLEAFNSQIGGMNRVINIDCQSVDEKLLPIIAHYDDFNILTLFDSNEEDLSNKIQTNIRMSVKPSS